MSVATFHRQFRSVTSLSPIQYQKQLRLLEARRMILTSQPSIGETAYQVGYSSASQFSREYTRMFGKSPRADRAMWVRLQTQVKQTTWQIAPGDSNVDTGGETGKWGLPQNAWRHHRGLDLVVLREAWEPRDERWNNRWFSLLLLD